MTTRILTGDCRDVLATLPAESVDAVVTDPPYDLTAGNGAGVASVDLDSPYGSASFSYLDKRISAPVACITECDEVRELVRLPVVGEEAKRANMVHRLAGSTARLARVGITLQRGTSLRLPVLATLRGRSTEVLRMQWTDSVSVTTFTRTVLSLAGRACRMAWGALIGTTTSDTGQHDMSVQASAYGLVLTLRGTRLSPPVPKSGFGHLKWLATSLAVHGHFHTPSIKQGVGR